MTARRLIPIMLILVALGAAALAVWQMRGVPPESLPDVIRLAERTVVHEGLPHQNYEQAQVQQERRTKRVHELHGYLYYQQPLKPTEEDIERLAAILGDAATFQPFTGEKKCGGFHPDYAVEYQRSGDSHFVAICFGCGEAKISAATDTVRYDLNHDSEKKLKDVLFGYRKNRPSAPVRP